MVRLLTSHPCLVKVIFVFFMAIGNMIGYSIMKIWDVPAHHMLKLMLIFDSKLADCCVFYTRCMGTNRCYEDVVSD